MRMKFFGAHTEPGSHYPGYVSVGQLVDGKVEITVRGPARPNGSEGAISSLAIPLDVFDQLIDEIRENRAGA